MNQLKPDYKILSLLKTYYRQFSKARRRQILLLLCLMVASSFLELIALGAIIPFLTILSDPGQLYTQQPFKHIITALKINSQDNLILFVSILFIIACVLSASIRTLTLWANLRLSAAIGSDLSVEAYKRTLLQPYEVNIRRNSSSLITAITAYTSSTVSAFNSIFTSITNSISSIVLLIGLALVSWKNIMVVAIIVTCSYSLVGRIATRDMKRNSKQIAFYLNKVQQLLQEGFGAIRDVVMSGSYEVYASSFSETERPVRRLQSSNTFIATSPSIMVELIGIICLVLIAIFIYFDSSSTSNILVPLGSLAFAAQKFIPAVQKIYFGYANLRGRREEMISLLELVLQPLANFSNRLPIPLDFRHSVVVQNLKYSYSNDNTVILSIANTVIQKGETIGVFGKSGSGKSTFIDLLMGLIVPSSGEIIIDSVSLHNSSRSVLQSWRASIAHVPQTIFLSDTSVAENIAFGLKFNEIDMNLVRDCAKKAFVADEIEQLPSGYLTKIGERGISLSGGQRQRLGIARALYKQSSIYVLDEATSALDQDTEKLVLDSLISSSDSSTIIMISHKLQSLQVCDRVFHVHSGTVEEVDNLLSLF